jgi:hypothetical protein
VKSQCKGLRKFKQFGLSNWQDIEYLKKNNNVTMKVTNLRISNFFICLCTYASSPLDSKCLFDEIHKHVINGTKNYISLFIFTIGVVCLLRGLSSNISVADGRSKWSSTDREYSKILILVSMQQ